ncbi:hypothetical protein KKE60_05635 [Patescibacteria group bacterium]|nr:hypothetical protein [Patescibacteria group bacterium]
MADNLNTIVLRGKGHHDEGEADAAISPGEAVRLAADGCWDPETLAADVAAGRGIVLAKENALEGQTVDDAYADGDILFLYYPIPGDVVHVLVKLGEDIDVGDYLDVEGSGSGKFIEVSSAATAEYKLSLTSAKVWDAMATDLPAAAANDDMGLITGTPGTDAPTLQGVDFGGAATDEKCAFEFVLPPEYRAGSAITLRCKAGMLTTVADENTTAVSLDAEVWVDAGTGLVGSDICATAAQACNSLTMANLDFTITPTGLEPGNRLIINLTLAGDDAGNLGVMIPEIQNVALLVGNAAVGRLMALEDSGGALAAAALLRCRVMGL